MCSSEGRARHILRRRRERTSVRDRLAGISTDGPFGGGHAETIYRSLLSDEYGKLVSRAGGIGIADAVHREILKLQESES